MSNYKIAFLNPIRFHQLGSGDFFYNMIKDWEVKRGYNQIYYHGDRPYLQILSESATASMTMQLIDQAGTIYKSWLPSFMTVTGFDSYHIYHWFNPLPDATTAPSGYYFLKLTISDSDGYLYFYSEPIYLTSSVENCVAIEYTHDENDFDVRFTGIASATFLMRLVAGVRCENIAPGGKFTMFQDQGYKSVVLNSQPYNVEKWTFGPSTGIPNYLADKINRIFGLSSVKIDGVGYSRNEGAKMERIGDPSNPLAGWTMDLVKSDNPHSESFEYIAGLTPLLCSNNTVLCSNNVILASAETY